MPAIIRKEHRKSKPRSTWETPWELFRPLDSYFNFDLDPCASEKNAKCERYITKKMDGLVQPWHKIGKCAFVNPPYTRGAVARWLDKVWHEANHGVTSTVLLPTDPSTDWWWDYVTCATELWLLKGRVKFVGASGSPNFSSALAIYKPRGDSWLPGIAPKVLHWNWRIDEFSGIASPAKVK